MEERESTAAGLFTRGEADVPVITPPELDRLLAGPSPPIVLDVRSRSSFERDGWRIPVSLRVLPDQIIEWAHEQPKDRSIVTYCT